MSTGSTTETENEAECPVRSLFNEVKGVEAIEGEYEGVYFSLNMVKELIYSVSGPTALADAVKMLYERPEETTRSLAEGKPPLVDDKPRKKKKVLLG